MKKIITSSTNRFGHGRGGQISFWTGGLLGIVRVWCENVVARGVAPAVAHLLAIPHAVRVILLSAIVSVKELLKPLQELKVILETAFNKLVYGNNLEVKWKQVKNIRAVTNTKSYQAQILRMHDKCVFITDQICHLTYKLVKCLWASES